MGTEASADCVVVGAGIIGLAHALAAQRRGLRTVVIDRDAQAVGASIRNFGFVTVTGQQAGHHLARARCGARDVWAEVAPKAGIAVLQHGLLVCARRPEALAVLEEFAAERDGRGLPDAGAARHCCAPLRGRSGGRAGKSARTAGGKPRRRSRAWRRGWRSQGVRFLRATAVHAVESGRVHTAAGTLRGAAYRGLSRAGSDDAVSRGDGAARHRAVQAAHAARGGTRLRRCPRR